MVIVLVGGGKIGFHLIRALIEQHHEVTLVEQDARTSEMVYHTYEVPVIVGDGTNPDILTRAGIERADAVVALAGRDQDNFVICKIAKQLFGVKRVLARVNDPRNEDLFKLAGVNLLIGVTGMVARAIEYEIVPHQAVTLFTWHQRVEVVELILPPASPVVGLPIRKLDLPECSVLSAIWRDNTLIIPDGNTVLQTGDEVFAMTRLGQEDQLRAIFLGPG